MSSLHSAASGPIASHSLGIDSQVALESAVAPPPPKVLQGNFLWTLAANGINALAQALIVMLLAKASSAEAVGKYALGLAVATPVFQFCGLQLRAVQVTDARNNHSLRELTGMRLITTATGLVAVLAIALTQHGPQEFGVIVVLGFAKAIESLSDLCQGVFQKNERMKQVAISLILKSLISITAVALILKCGGGVLAASLGIVISGLFTLTGYDIRTVVRRYSKSAWDLCPRIDWPAFRHLFLLTLPLGAVMMLMSFNSNIPRYFLAKYSGEASVGVFSAILYCVVAENMVMAALGQAASPRLAKLHAEGKTRDFCLLIGKLAIFGALVGTAGIVASRVAGAQILTLLFRPEYASHVDSLMWLMAAGVLMNITGILGVAVTAMHAFRPQVWVHLSCAVAGLASSLLLIPSHGVQGGAISVVVMSAVGLAGFSLLFLFGVGEPKALRTAREALFR